MVSTIQNCWEIIFLHLHKLGPKLSFKEIAKELHCSKDTVKTWIHRYQETGDVQDQEKIGEKGKLLRRRIIILLLLQKD